jgi:hypothetical protein
MATLDPLQPLWQSGYSFITFILREEIMPRSLMGVTSERKAETGAEGKVGLK